jgi:hypothetical protein
VQSILQASADLSDVVNQALASGQFANIHYVTDKKYDGLKAFVAGRYQPANKSNAARFQITPQS